MPIGAGTRCADYRKELERRAAQLGQSSAVDVPYKLQRMGVPADALLALRRPNPTKALEGAKRFLVAPRDLVRTLLLVGPRGVGKSVAAAYVLWDWARGYEWNSGPSGGRRTEPAAWVHAAEMTSETDFGRVNPEWLEGLKRAHVLVLDDLGNEAGQPGRVALRDVLVARYEARRPTVVTGNMRTTELAQVYGESWYDRLKSSALAPDLWAEKPLRTRAEVRP